MVHQVQSIAASSRESSVGMEKTKSLSVNQARAVQTIVEMTRSLVDTSDHLRDLVAVVSGPMEQKDDVAGPVPGDQ